jgi:hypothetical protein
MMRRFFAGTAVDNPEFVLENLRGRISLAYLECVPMKLTKRVLDTVKPNPNHDLFFWDDEVPKTCPRVDVKTGFRGRAIVEGGAGTASRTVGLLGGILSFAVSEGFIAVNPVRGVRRPADNRREIRLTADQYRALANTLAEAEAKGENSSVILAILHD